MNAFILKHNRFYITSWGQWAGHINRWTKTLSYIDIEKFSVWRHLFYRYKRSLQHQGFVTEVFEVFDRGKSPGERN